MEAFYRRSLPSFAREPLLDISLVTQYWTVDAEWHAS